MYKYLVTGGSGFIGANLVRRLVKENKKVFLFVEKKSNLWRLQDIISDLVIYEVSLIDFDQINKLVDLIKPDVTFHLAAYGGLPGQNDQKQIFDVNFYGTVNLLNSCKKNGFECFVNTGSSSEYGIKNSAMKEDDFLEPVSDYGVCKAASTQFCLKEALFNKLPVYTVRPFAVYGDFEMQGRLIPTILLNALSGQQINLSSPNFVRDFIYVEDMINFYLNVSSKKPKEQYVFNSGTGVQSTIKQVVETVQILLNKEVFIDWGSREPRPWEPKTWQASIDNAEKYLNWRPEYSLENGLKKSLEWFRNNSHLYQLNVKKYEFKQSTKSQ